MQVVADPETLYTKQNCLGMLPFYTADYIHRFT